MIRQFACMMLLCGSVAIVSEAGAQSPASAQPRATAPSKAAKPAAEKKDAKTTPTQPWHVFPPLVWGCEDEWSVQFGGDVQYRRESRKNYDMIKGTHDDDHLQFLRTRLAFDVWNKPCFRAFLQVQDAHTYNEAVDPLQSVSWDVHQAFVELRDYCPDSPWVLRLGRMEMPIIGEGRVFGSPPLELQWVNLFPAFDGAMIDYKTKDIQSHTFVMQRVYHQTLMDDVVVSDHGRGLDHEWFYGNYTTIRCLAPHEYDLYFLGLSDLKDDRVFPFANASELGIPGTADRYTVGTRWRGPICKNECGTLGYGFEGAYQFGHVSRDEIDAYMIHADINYQWEDPWKPKITLLGNVATGDRKPGDGETNRFSPLFGASHYGYGIIDFVRLQNLREIALLGTFEPRKDLRFTAGLHQFWLDSRTDAWITAFGTSPGRDVTGQSGRDIGNEVDLTMTWKACKNLTLEAGAAHFMPGNFAEKQGRGDNANFFYVMTVFTF